MKSLSLTPLAFCVRTLLLAVLACTQVWAQTWPTRPITLVVPYPPGGTADILARHIAQKLGDRLGSVVVENRAGAGTAIGSRFVAEAAADGYTLLLGTVSSHAINPAINQVGYDPINDFVPIAPLASIPFVLVTHPATTFNVLADVLTAARAMPGTVSYASAGPGTSNHLAGEILATDANVQLLHVPYRGSAPALADVLAGHVPLMFDLQSTATPNIRSGKLRAIAITARQRSALLPDVPTMIESGMTNYTVSAWFAVFAPQKVPPAIANRLSTEIAQVMHMPDMRATLQNMGADPDARSASQFKDYLHEEVARYTQVVRAAGLTP